MINTNTNTLKHGDPLPHQEAITREARRIKGAAEPAILTCRDCFHQHTADKGKYCPKCVTGWMVNDTADAAEMAAREREEFDSKKKPADLDLNDLSDEAQRAARYDMQDAWVESEVDENIVRICVKRRHHWGGKVSQQCQTAIVAVDEHFDSVKEIVEGNVISGYADEHGDRDPEGLLNPDEADFEIV